MPFISPPRISLKLPLTRRVELVPHNTRTQPLQTAHPPGIQPRQQDQRRRKLAIDHDLEGAISGLEGSLNEHGFRVRVRGYRRRGEHVARHVGEGVAVAEQLAVF
jgi:hypothetical protein